MRIPAIAAALLVAAAAISEAAAQGFYQYGPISCSSKYGVATERSADGAYRITVDLPEGPRTFLAKGWSKKIPFRQMPQRGSMKFGPDDAVTCEIDTSVVVGISKCSSYARGTGWAGQCEYCAKRANGVECEHIGGSLTEVTKRPRPVSLPLD